MLQAIKKSNLRPPTAISCQVPSGYKCGAVSGGSTTTTCASPSCDNGYSGSASTGAAVCTTGTGYWSLSGCTGRLRLKCVARGTRRFRRTCFVRQGSLLSVYRQKCELQGLGRRFSFTALLCSFILMLALLTIFLPCPSLALL